MNWLFKYYGKFTAAVATEAMWLTPGASGQGVPLGSEASVIPVWKMTEQRQRKGIRS